MQKRNTQKTRPPASTPRSPGKTGHSPRLPHEHDESDDSQDASGEDRPDKAVIKQAHDDIVTGKKDTDLHGTSGLDKPLP